jgi:ADP-ribose pyrophosphatase
MTSKAAKQEALEKENLQESKQVYKGKLLNLRLDTFKLGAKTKTAEIVEHPGAVAILPVDSHNRIHLVQQWRRAAKEIVLEIPAGTLNKKEDPLEAAQRELREETGFSSDKLTPIGGFFSAPGFCDEFIHLFIAEHLKQNPLPPDEGEEIDLITLSLEEVLRLIERGKIRDAKTIAAILRYNYWKTSCSDASSG